MRKPFLIACLGVLAATQPVAAHDFWIDVPRYKLDKPGEANASFLIGTTAAVEQWKTTWPRIVALRRHGPDGVHDLLGSIRLSSATTAGGAAITLAGAAPGTYVIAFESNHAFSDLPGDRFTSYAEHEGLALPLARRKQAGTENSPGRELYSRRAKALIQIGNTPSADAGKAVGHTLEIVPLVNPYALPDAGLLPVRVWYRGQPLAGASVALESLDDAKAPAITLITNARGEASFGFRKAGRWKLNCVWSAPIDDERAEYETIFSSLTFGY